MSRLTLSIDPQLLTQAQDALGTRTKTETVRHALEEVVRWKRLKGALSHRGRIDLSLDQKKLAELRAER